MKKVLRTVNDTGLGIKSGDERDKIQDIRVFIESGQVHIWFGMKDDMDYLQYLDSREAMALAKVLERLACDALRSESESRY